ncbi:UDP-N-acetylmuramyl-tripeptide synthetase [Patescibacteria group bacterium]|nr:UDP-N-acetylmuramyl-tripeptide synthetase [Patescibacteria group bacterium]MBU1895932.1 UDP-N-acetylmuramyl-tripeptide synthetase [Patescibacteria group bacterium]
MKSILKKIIPKPIRNLMHLYIAYSSACKYKNPSEHMFVIGVTGTSGKSSTVYFLRQILESAGYIVGSLTTIDFYIAGKSKMNDQKMTTLGRGMTQKYLRDMVDAGCDIAIIETSSEGYVQNRHKYINFDTVILTNLYPEHIESHGSFEKYKEAKLGILKHVSKCKPKYRLAAYKKVAVCDMAQNTKEQCAKIPKTCVLNANNEYLSEFLEIDFEEKLLFGRNDEQVYINKNERKKYDCTVCGENLSVNSDGLHFILDKSHYFAPLYGEHNIMNVLAGIAVVKSLGVEEDLIMNSVVGLNSPPGRIEFIKEAEKLDFKIIVDYAFEPVALAKLYEVVDLIKPKKIIHVCGSAGGGRDQSRRAPIGNIVGNKANIVIVTDEDPYDEDPMEIIKMVSQGAIEMGKVLGKDLFEILDRKEAIKKAVDLAQEGDLVLVTGKGSEQKICVAGGKMLDWDDRGIVREALRGKKS